MARKPITKGGEGVSPLKKSMHIQASNLSDALVKIAHQVMNHGSRVEVKSKELMECSPLSVFISHPLQCFPLLAHRKNNPFSAIAESIWVLSGRNDVEWLSHYLPRAKDFSDDGETWRGGYGPRLRYFGTNKVDQVRKVYELLKADPASRQGIISIYDPDLDCDAKEWSKDIPCNNVLQFIIRDNKLHCYSYVRSNDLVWGFSGINVTEWAILQSFLASNLEVQVGNYYHTTGSMHIYEAHYDKIKAILKTYTHEKEYYTHRDSCLGERETTVQFNLPIVNIDISLPQFFNILEKVQNEEISASQCIEEIKLLDDNKWYDYKNYLMCLCAYEYFKQKSYMEAFNIMVQVKSGHLKLACLHWLLRNSSGTIGWELCTAQLTTRDKLLLVKKGLVEEVEDPFLKDTTVKVY